MDDPQENFKNQVQKFLELYRVLPSEARAKLEIELGGFLKDKDVGTQKLYFALLEAAKDGQDIDGVVASLRVVREA